ncbi:MAG TPA: polyprenyl synthetase family protein [Pyrinomonadaceae bacterium]|nr:polyprenyl synthetase family protein [Pyrinomonadaceae bacterium]
MHHSGHSAALEEPTTTARRVFNLVAPELVLVEAEFERQARSNVQVIAYVGEYLRASGGKRVRPALTLLSNYAVGGDASRPNVVRMATVMEFLHTATLVHDDIIDNAETRRSRRTVNSRFGNQTAVLMGDWLYMSAFETSLQERSLPVLDILTAATRRMTEGELIQLTLLGRADLTEEQHFDILRRKTAYLFAACCEIGAILGGATDEERRALADYGLNLGTAFQLVDDLLDFTSDGDSLGKAAGADLLEGKVTLPLIYLLADRPEMRAGVLAVMREGGYGEVSREALRAAAEQSGALGRARARAAEYARAAAEALGALRPSKYADALRSIPSFILDREV